MKCIVDMQVKADVVKRKAVSDRLKARRATITRTLKKEKEKK